MTPKRPGQAPGNQPGAPGLRPEQLMVILRAADDLNGRGGVELLAALLKGSRDIHLRKLGLENSPVFGVFEQVELDQIHSRIIQAVQSGYLGTSQVNPDRLVITDAGRTIERDTLVAELLDEFEVLLDDGEPFEVSYLLEQDRAVVARLLDQIESRGDESFIPLLEAWEPLENRKTRSRINQVIARLSA